MPRSDGNRNNESGRRSFEIDDAGSTQRGAATQRMAPSRSRSSSKAVRIDESVRRAVDVSADQYQGGKVPDPRNPSIRIPSRPPLNGPTVTAIWDWEAPPANTNDSTYYYEPVGELLNDRGNAGGARNEFSIPTAVSAVSGSGLDWLSANNNLSAPISASGGEAAAQARISLKRKVSDRDRSLGSQQKRAVVDMAGQSGDVVPPPNPNPRDSLQGGSQGAATAGIRRTLTDPSQPMLLPARKVFPIQIGDKLFRLSGASISSDAPSYFSQSFEEQLRQNEGTDNVRTLYIDRDPSTFEDISLHLQGYHIEPRDGPHFVKLFADAQFFSLPRLTAQLFSSAIYIRIGDCEFQIPRDLFSNPGDSPNYFTLGFAVFFTTPTDAFPGLSQRTLLRPPSVLPPSVPNRSAKTFSDLLHILKGYPVEIRNEEHRQEILRDARYFHLKGLEQKLIPHNISYNLARGKSEILLRIEDIRQSGISFVADNTATSGLQTAAPSPDSTTTLHTPAAPGWVYYQRPYVDSEAYTLILELAGEENMLLSIAPGPRSAAARLGRATFHRQTLARITSLFSVIANKMNLPVAQPLGLLHMERSAGLASLPVSPGNTGVSEDRVKVRLGADADVTIDGRRWVVGDEYGAEDEDDGDEDEDEEMEMGSSSRTGGGRRCGDGDADDGGYELVVRKSQWRIRVQPITGGMQAGSSGMEVILGAVKVEAFGNERARNVQRGFLA